MCYKDGVGDCGWVQARNLPKTQSVVVHQGTQHLTAEVSNELPCFWKPVMRILPGTVVFYW